MKQGDYDRMRGIRASEVSAEEAGLWAYVAAVDACADGATAVSAAYSATVAVPHTVMLHAFSVGLAARRHARWMRKMADPKVLSRYEKRVNRIRVIPERLMPPRGRPPLERHRGLAQVASVL